jgi:predicted dehydrogenase
MIREAPPHWQEALGELGQPKAQLAHVEIWWDPGCLRWLLMECIPPEGVSDDIRLQLLTYPDKTAFRMRQAAYFREHGKIPLAFWIIQGDQGGHRLQYGEHEATLAQFYGGSREPPKAGSLPYAEFDNRVVAALHGYDRAMSKFATLQAAYDGDAKAALEQMRRDMLAQADSMRDVSREAAADVYAADTPLVEDTPDYEKIYDEFVTTGDMPQHTGSLTPGGSATVPLETL